LISNNRNWFEVAGLQFDAMKRTNYCPAGQSVSLFGNVEAGSDELNPNNKESNPFFFQSNQARVFCLVSDYLL